jgi:pentatricopeptide repeat protein
VSYETLIAAFGIAGRAEEAEKAFNCMLAAGESGRLGNNGKLARW